jgi:uncharacterized membrane protein
MTLRPSSGQGSSLDLHIGRLLRVGVTASTICLAAGLLLAGASPAAGSRLLHAGLIILIATPPARVVLSVVEYARERDWRFVALSAIVLLELMAGAVAALVFHRGL